MYMKSSLFIENHIYLLSACEHQFSVKMFDVCGSHYIYREMRTPNRAKSN